MKKSILLLSIILIRNILFSQAGDIPTNLQIDAASVGGVTLSWDIPENYRKEWMSHSTFAFVYGIGNQGLDPANYFHKFPDSLLAEYHNMLVTEIAFFPASISSWQPFVFETDPATPGNNVPDIINLSNCVLSAPQVTYINGFNTWKVHELFNHVEGTSSDPFVNDTEPSTYRIDSTKTLWYGYTVFDYQPLI